MRFIRLVQPLAAGLLAVALLSAAGCPSSSVEKADPPKPTPTPTVEPIQPPPADDAALMPRPPVGEFQQPAVQPPADPLPKLALEPAERPMAPIEKEPVEKKSVEETRALVKELPIPIEKPAKPAAKIAASADPATPAAEVTQNAARRPRTGKNSGIPFDPIKENGPIFKELPELKKDWPKPKAVLVITGVERGYIEPCGCAGLDRMKGGMTRRATFLRQLRDEKGWPTVAIDVGGLARGFGRQAEMKFHALVDGKVKMGYNAVAFGADDLRLPAGELVSVAAEVNGRPSMFLSANVGLFGLDQNITQTHRVIEAGGRKIGITAILGLKYQKEINNAEIEMSDPATALKKIVPELKKKADYLVLLAHATREESIELAKQFPEFDVVVTSDGPEVPPQQPETVPGTKTLLITVGQKGMCAIALGLYDDRQTPWRYQRVPLDSRFTASPDMKALMAAYQEQLKSVGFAGLGLRPAAHPMAEANGRFVGSKKCQACHEKSYDIWKKSLHSKAYDTLAKLDPPRNFDPECVSCHVVGWHPTRFFPYQSGFESLEKTPHLTNTGCEDCHGPGEKHVAAEMGADEALQKKYRKAVVITKEDSKKRQCMECHDLDNSPDFDFDAYWPLVEHREKEE